jgi:prevent-host-death family protein
MIKVGAFEAKTHLSSLLEKVSRGEEVLITRRGKPIARLVPAEPAERSDIGAAIDELLIRRKEVTLGGLSWKDLRDEGRR